MTCIPVCNQPAVCHLQRASVRMLFSYEGTIRLCLPQSLCAFPLRLCAMDVSEIHILKDTDCRMHPIPIKLELLLCCTAIDPAGKRHLCSAMLQFAIPKANMHVCQSHLDAEVKLIHARCLALDTFHICAQILLTQTQCEATANNCMPRKCLQRLPLYPHLTGMPFVKSVEKHC